MSIGRESRKRISSYHKIELHPAWTCRMFAVPGCERTLGTDPLAMPSRWEMEMEMETTDEEMLLEND